MATGDEISKWSPACLNWLHSEWLFHQKIFSFIGDRLWDVVTESKLYEKVELILETVMPKDEILFELKKNIVEKIKLFNNKDHESDEYNFGFTFISCLTEEDNKKFRFVVFRSSSDVNSDSRNDNYTTGLPSSLILIDMDCRQYESWSDFLASNELPKCFMMYPKNGVYIGSDFLEVVCEKSVACSLKSSLMRGLVVGTNVVGVGAAATAVVISSASTGVLLAVSVLSIFTGLLALGCSVFKLCDIAKHEAIDFKNSKTNLVIADVACNAVGLCTTGVAGAVKSIADKTGKVFIEGSIAYKIANNVSRIAKFFLAANSIYTSGKFIFENYENIEDFYLNIKKNALMICNVAISDSSLEKETKTMSKSDCENVIDSIISHKSSEFSVMKRVTRISADQFNTLTENLSPESEAIKFLDKPIKDVQFIIDLTNKVLEKKLDITDFIYTIRECLNSLKNNTSECVNKVQEDIKENYGLYLTNTVFDLINTNKIPVEFGVVNLMLLKKLIHNSVIRFSNPCYDKLVFDFRKRLLFYKIFFMVEIHIVPDIHYAVNKFKYYCEVFDKLAETEKNKLYFEAFKYSITHKTSMDVYFKKLRKIKGSVSEFIFTYCLDKMLKDINHIHKEFKANYDLFKNTHFKYETYNLVMKRQVELIENKKLTQEEVYKEINLIPSLSEIINSTNSTCDVYFDNMAIINSQSHICYLYADIKGTGNDLNCVILLCKKNELLSLNR